MKEPELLWMLGDLELPKGFPPIYTVVLESCLTDDKETRGDGAGFAVRSHQRTGNAPAAESRLTSSSIAAAPVPRRRARSNAGIQGITSKTGS